MKTKAVRSRAERLVHMMKERRSRSGRTAGFTLVELIVVIAILAILAGVGTVAYSGYVKKANKAVDQQLVADIKYAVELAFVSDPDAFTGTQVIVLNTAEDAYYNGDALRNAVIAAFGDNINFRLKYDGWTDTATMLDNVGASNPYAASVGDSSYIQNVGTTQLLGDVQDCASALGGFLDNLVSDNNQRGTILERYLGTSLGELLTDADVATRNGDGSYNYSNASKEDLSNATVFCLADYLNEDEKQQAIINMFSEEYGVGLNDMSVFVDGADSDMLYKTACWYAAMEGFVSYLDDDACTEAFKSIDMTSNNALTILGEMSLAQQTISNAINAGIPDDAEGIEDCTTPLAQKAMTYYMIANSDGKTQAQLDAESFLGVMKTVDNLSGDYTNKSSMGNESLFANGDMIDRVDSFVAAAAISNFADLEAVKTKAQGSSVVIVVANGAMMVCPTGALVS